MQTERIDPGRLRLSLFAVLFTVTLFAAGLALVRVDHRSPGIFCGTGLFLIGSCPGLLFGYTQKRWLGAVICGLISGGLFFGVVVAWVSQFSLGWDVP